MLRPGFVWSEEYLGLCMSIGHDCIAVVGKLCLFHACQLCVERGLSGDTLMNKVFYILSPLW